MKTIRGIALVAGLLLLVSGCTSLRRVGKALIPGRPAQSPPADVSTPTETKTDGDGLCLERHGFAVLDFRAIRDAYDQVSVIGEIKNTGSAARGVELQASLRDAGGRLLAVGHFFPSSYQSIVPGETWPFTYSFGRQEDAADAELRIVGAFRTIDLVNVVSTGR
jgi:hypothetical protein